MQFATCKATKRHGGSVSVERHRPVSISAKDGRTVFLVSLEDASGRMPERVAATNTHDGDIRLQAATSNAAIPIA